MTQTTVRRDRKAERHLATKREIVDAAWSLARERGVDGWSLRDVAEVVGMRAPSLYVYFDSKSALYDAMFADGYEQFLARIAAEPRDGEPAALLHRAARLFFEFCVEDPARHQLLFLRTVPGFVPSEQSYGLAKQCLDGVVDLLRAAGFDRQQDVDLWTALMTGLATQQVSNDPGGKRWARLVDDATDMYLAGAGRGGGARGRSTQGARHHSNS